MTGKEETNTTEQGAVKMGTCQRSKGFMSVLTQLKILRLQWQDHTGLFWALNIAVSKW